MVHDYSFFGSIADFVIKKGTFWIFTGFGHLQMSETLGRNHYVAKKQDKTTPMGCTLSV
jgi:H+/gluconate symporter-like permease